MERRRKMDFGCASNGIFLCLLLVMCSKVSEAREVNAAGYPMNDDIPTATGTNVLGLHSMDSSHKDDHDAHVAHVHAHPSSHMGHMMDPSLMVFFTIEDLKVGKRMPIYFPKTDPSSSPHFLPREESDSIPFSLEKFPSILQIFSLLQGSPQAEDMEATLRMCETKPVKGETKICATSLESMLDFVRENFGFDSQFKVVTTTHFTELITLIQNYTILKNPKEISAKTMVACHTVPYLYAIFYCHYQESESKVFKVLLGGENGARVEAVAVCHMDTSEWSPRHVSFRVLGIEPGSKPVCHFFPANHLVWVASPSLI